MILYKFELFFNVDTIQIEGIIKYVFGEYFVKYRFLN